MGPRRRSWILALALPALVAAFSRILLTRYPWRDAPAEQRPCPLAFVAAPQLRRGTISCGDSGARFATQPGACSGLAGAASRARDARAEEGLARPAKRSRTNSSPIAEEKNELELEQEAKEAKIRKLDKALKEMDMAGIMEVVGLSPQVLFFIEVFIFIGEGRRHADLWTPHKWPLRGHASVGRRGALSGGGGAGGHCGRYSMSCKH